MSWNEINLDEICRPKQWATLPMSALSESGYPVFGANGIIGYYDKYTHEEPTLLITCRGATCGTINISLPYSYVNGNAMALDNLDIKKVNLKFLYYFLRKRKLNDTITGSAQPQITRESLKKVKIPLPPLEEQKRIAAVLDKADEVRQKRRAAINKLDELLQSVFLDMFGDPVSNPKGWEVKTLGELLHFRTGKLDSNAAVAGGAYPFFTCSKETYQIDNYAFDCEALLLAGNNATADYSVKYYNGKFNAYQRTYVITLINPKHSYLFMRYTLERKLGEMKKFSKGTNTKYLTLAILQNLKMPIPSTEAQAEFERFNIEIENLRNKHLKAEIHLDNLFQSLQQRAFAGELFGANDSVKESNAMSLF